MPLQPLALQGPFLAMKLTHKFDARLAECTDLLRTLVIPRLRLRDTHALRQTSRACQRAVAGAGLQLERLALVRCCPKSAARCPH